MKLIPVILVLIFWSCQHSGTSGQIKNSDTLKAALKSKVDTTANPESEADTTLYTMKDTIIITPGNFDTLIFSKKDFNEIVDNFPELYNPIPLQPDISYHKSGIFKDIIDINGNAKHISFGSEVGQDTYYALYAYFLKKKTKGRNLETRRNRLISIYNNINHIFSSLSYGGTYFGHQYRRIIGYAEYSIYWYSKDDDFYSRSSDITAQKKLYINSLKQLISDEVNIDQNTFGTKAKTDRKKELFEIVKNIDSLITDYFYLKAAQNFQHSNYR